MKSDKHCYLVFLEKTEPETEAEVMQSHAAYLRQLEASGNLVTAGSIEGSPKELTVLRASNLAEATELAEKDPFVRTGARIYEIKTLLLN